MEYVFSPNRPSGALLSAHFILAASAASYFPVAPFRGFNPQASSVGNSDDDDRIQSFMCDSKIVAGCHISYVQRPKSLPTNELTSKWGFPQVIASITLSLAQCEETSSIRTLKMLEWSMALYSSLCRPRPRETGLCEQRLTYTGVMLDDDEGSQGTHLSTGERP